MASLVDTVYCTAELLTKATYIVTDGLSFVMKTDKIAGLFRADVAELVDALP